MNKKLNAVSGLSCPTFVGQPVQQIVCFSKEKGDHPECPSFGVIRNCLMYRIPSQEQM
jgi:hypothetical protein